MTMTEALTETPWVPADTFGSRLARIRNEMHWNVKEAAEACGLNDQSWRNWEEGKKPRDLLDVAARIAKATGCHQRWLVMGDQNWKKLMGPGLRIVHSSGPAVTADGDTGPLVPPDRSRHRHLHPVT